jgi:hypothetical protein
MRLDPEIGRQFEGLTRSIKTSLGPAREAVAELNEYLSEYRQQIQRASEVIGETFRKLPDDTRRAQAYLAQRGWFISFQFLSLPRIGWIARRGEAGEHDAVEGYVVNHVQWLKDAVIDKVREVSPDRTHIVEQAVEAHDSGKYAVSIPAMLAQSDGLFFEVAGKTFFSNDDDDLEDTRRRLLKALADAGEETTASSLTYLLVRQLHEESSMHESFGQAKASRLSDPAGELLNRHMVLHGRSTEYYTERNSLCAIALLDLLCDVKESLLDSDESIEAV